MFVCDWLCFDVCLIFFPPHILCCTCVSLDLSEITWLNKANNNDNNTFHSCVKVVPLAEKKQDYSFAHLRGSCDS